MLVFGLLVPAISALQSYWSTRRRARLEVEPQDKEAELLGALGEVGELTATTAAMRTTLTVEETAGMLEKLSKNSRLQNLLIIRSLLRDPWVWSCRLRESPPL